MFHYKVNFWDDFLKKPREEQGLLAADSYALAAEKVLDYYGADDLNDMWLSEYDDMLTEEDITDAFDGEDE